MLGCHPKLGGAPIKIGTRPHKQKYFKIWRLVLHVAAEKCYCVWTDCEGESVEQERIALKGKKGTLNGASRSDSLTKNYYATTRTTPTTLHKPPCSTRPPVKLNNTGQWTLHKPRPQQLHRPLDFTRAHASSTSPDAKVHQLHIYNNRQQHSTRQRHTCVYRLISLSQ